MLYIKKLNVVRNNPKYRPLSNNLKVTVFGVDKVPTAPWKFELNIYQCLGLSSRMVLLLQLDVIKLLANR